MTQEERLRARFARPGDCKTYRVVRWDSMFWAAPEGSTNWQNWVPLRQDVDGTARALRSMSFAPQGGNHE